MGHRHCQFSLGDTIVSTLQPFSFFERSLDMYFDMHKDPALVGPLILSAMPQLRKDIEQLQAAGNHAYPLYAEITRNSSRPLKIPSDMRPSEFHTLFTGKNLRWEILGLIMAVAGSNAQYTSPNDALFTLEDGKQMNREEFIEDIMHATNTCINICQTHGAVNELMTCVVYINLMVVSSFYGDNRASIYTPEGYITIADPSRSRHMEAYGRQCLRSIRCRHTLRSLQRRWHQCGTILHARIQKTPLRRSISLRQDPGGVLRTTSDDGLEVQ
jgi:hypothetical protein